MEMTIWEKSITETFWECDFYINKIVLENYIELKPQIMKS